MMRFSPYLELAGRPNVVVDGGGTEGTVLTLSHWPKSGTPADLKDDLSAQIAFRYLDRREPAPAELVSNDHFDEDGLASVFALEQPALALAHRDLVIDVAAAGDFATYRDRRAARIAFVIARWNDPETSPLPAALFTGPYPQRAAAVYQALLPRVPALLTQLDRFRADFADEDAHLEASERALREGAFTIEELPALDLAIVRTTPGVARRAVHRFTQRREARWHPMAIHNATRCLRLLLIEGDHYELQFRYESWVQYMTRRPLPRVDLEPLAAALCDSEGTRWSCDPVSALTPRLSGTASHAPEAIIATITQHLASAPPAWDPYD
ncbi:MAG: hypothetical protein IT370_10995 [Deltaproteobacteria bacterium]|nr:hypothetical protein [Deltaproteobacteria bacterium]